MSNNKTFGERYEKLGTLGEGGNAKVYSVRDTHTGTEYALKPFTRCNDKEKLERFKREIQVVNDYKDSITGILPIIDYSMGDDKEYWYVMPIATEISKAIADRDKDYKFITNGIIQLSETLTALHEKGSSHRDIKPENIYYYNDMFYIGDFGLVSLLDPDESLTKPCALGAYATMAPEMRRDPHKSDGKKADVYSLAKTLWIMLTKKLKGFDGVYDIWDEKIGLRFDSIVKDIHIVELEELLRESTDNDPDKRPTMKEFGEQLKQWLAMKPEDNYSVAVQNSEWKFINKYLFGGNSLYTPETVVWENKDKIRNVLSLVAALPALNHMICDGGLDLSKVENASENDCLYLYEDDEIEVVKPKDLIYCNFPQDTRWNYFLLELDELEPVLTAEKSEEMPYEYLVEDLPGHYVSAEDAMYGVYDYDTGEPFPDGWKSVRRCYGGKFLICLKFGPYNNISNTYDGRHSQCTSQEFRKYITELIELCEKGKHLGIDEKIVLNSDFVSKNPFSKIDYDEKEKNDKRKIEEIDSIENYIRDNLSTWCFSELLSSTQDDTPHSSEFTIVYDRDHFMYDSSYGKIPKQILCKDGYFRTEPSSDDVFHCYSLDAVFEISDTIKEKIKSICNDNGFQTDLFLYINIEQKYLDISPSYLFTKDDIENLMGNADDRNDNILVINCDGHAEIIQNRFKSNYYPVRHETWDPRNKYVGKFSSLSTLEDDYISSLQGWLYFLVNHKNIKMDHVHEEKDIDNLISEIQKYYTDQ